MGPKLGTDGVRFPEGEAQAAPAAVAERQRDFRKEVEAAQPPAGATGAGRILPGREMSQKATEGWERERACSAGAYLHR